MCDIGVHVSIKRRSFQVWVPIIKMVMRPSYLYSRDSYTGKTTSLYKGSPLFSKWYSVKPGIALLKWHNNVFSTKAGEWMQIVFRLSYYWIKAWHQVLRGVAIQVPHDTIRTSIQRSRYNTYLDRYLNTVRCQRDVMSSMKAETPVIRSPAHNPATPVDGVPTTTTANVEPRRDFVELY